MIGIVTSDWFLTGFMGLVAGFFIGMAACSASARRAPQYVEQPGPQSYRRPPSAEQIARWRKTYRLKPLSRPSDPNAVVRVEMTAVEWMAAFNAWGEMHHHVVREFANDLGSCMALGLVEDVFRRARLALEMRDPSSWRSNQRLTVAAAVSVTPAASREAGGPDAEA